MSRTPSLRRKGALAFGGNDNLTCLGCFAVIAILAAILIPVLTQAREHARRTSCMANMRVLGVGLLQYSVDYDDHLPDNKGPALFIVPPTLTSVGWAGRIAPYLQSHDWTKSYGGSSESFHCPDDNTQGVNGSPKRLPISYGLNSNFAEVPEETRLTAPSRTVLLFEIAGDTAAVSAVNEERATGSPQLSAAGNGIRGYLCDRAIPAGPITNGAVYATGTLANSGHGSPLPIARYADNVGRHHDRSNFLTADGHARSRAGSDVSAGGNALATMDRQSATGCRLSGLGQKGDYPCAEGASNSTHALTFSVR